MKNSLSQKLLATILSAALLLNSSAMAFATDEGISGADGTPIVTASETAATTEETTSTDETTTNETTLLAEDATTDSNEQGDLSDPSGSDSVLPGEDANESDCTCNPAIGTSSVEGHGKDCPLYVAPAQPDCTCPPVDSGKIVHGKDCPLYEVPEVPTASDAVLALIAALPTMEELEAVDTEVPEFAAYLAKLRLDTAAARAAFDALTDEDKAAFDADALAKLAELEGVLAAMPVLLADIPALDTSNLSYQNVKYKLTEGTPNGTATVSSVVDNTAVTGDNNVLTIPA